MNPTKVLIIGGCGYVGSELWRFLAERAIQVETVDLELFGNNTDPENIRADYDELSQGFLAGYAAVILLAAHSSVPMAKADPNGALENNLLKFHRLLDKLRGQRFIYASSSSIYSGSGRSAVDEEWQNFRAINVYDLTKFAGDALASFSDTTFFGLRFGTVCGASPNLRTELMINSMVLSALEQGQIVVQNPLVHRPILGIRDLCRAVEALLRHPDPPRGVYNLASFNTTVSEVARAVQEATGAAIVRNPDCPTYDFSISAKKFEETFAFRFRETPLSIVEGLLTQHRMTGLRVRKTGQPADRPSESAGGLWQREAAEGPERELAREAK